MRNETKNTMESLPKCEGSAESPAKFRVKRIVRMFKDGSKKVESTCVEVADLEAFRKQLKIRGCTDVSFVYETI